MGTIIVKGHGAQAVHFMEYARTLPFVEVIEDDAPVRKPKRALVASIRKSRHGIGLTECKDVDDMFEKLGLFSFVYQ